MIKCLMRALPAALAAQAAAMTALCLIMLLFSRSSGIDYADALLISAVLFAMSWFVSFYVQLSHYGMKIYHRFDDDFIEDAFAGLGKKSALFEDALTEFHNDHYREALNGFSSIREGGYSLTDRENGVLEFYRGRCYQVMGFYPNAVLCYEKCSETAFSLLQMPLIMARCYADNGDTEKALQIYSSLVDTNHPLSLIVRTEAGKMYLRLNDGENALKWFDEAIHRRENFADALGGAAVAYTLLHEVQKGEDHYRAALLNNIADSENYMRYFKEIQAAVLLEIQSDKNTSNQ